MNAHTLTTDETSKVFRAHTKALARRLAVLEELATWPVKHQLVAARQIAQDVIADPYERAEAKLAAVWMNDAIDEIEDESGWKRSAMGGR